MLLGVLVGAVIMGVIAGIVIWIVGKLGLGIEVDGFGSAFMAALVIAVVNAVINWILGAVGFGGGSGIVGLLVNLIIAGAVILPGRRLCPRFACQGLHGRYHRRPGDCDCHLGAARPRGRHCDDVGLRSGKSRF
ncbi:MAG: phage holin family protein [Caldilineaceae bacterium]